ncbi:MAG: SufS family cysteine desulfurase [Johnsonella sp.]|nr:SufS family cysteine desulfurase [Johnsonella sp.]
MKLKNMTKQEEEIRGLFPLISEKDLIYLDNAATSQKPLEVMEAVEEYYKKHNANPMRGMYELSIEATEAYEAARKKVADFICAKEEEVIFTRNASESLNLIAYSYGMEFLKEGDEVLVAITEHHSNLLPWQNLARIKKLKLRYLECDQKGLLSEEALKEALSPSTKLLAVNQISNVLGRENPIKAFARIMHEAGGIIVVDAAQSIAHIPVDVKDLDADFLAFSGHKMYAPMGIGVLYGKAELLNRMPPFLFGGEMIESVSRESAVFAQIPHKFEAGTPNVGGAVGLGKAIDFIRRIGFDTIAKRELALCRLAFEEIEKDPHIHIIGADDPEDHHGIITFTIDDVHSHDIAEILSAEGIGVRAGHHCAQPLLRHLGMMSSARASLSFYNTEEELRYFTAVLKTIRERMGYAE